MQFPAPYPLTEPVLDGTLLGMSLLEGPQADVIGKMAGSVNVC